MPENETRCPDPDCAGVLGPDGRCSECGDDEDLDERRPCPDGACIGIIGPDGRCSECGAEAGDEDPSGDGWTPDAEDDLLEDEDDVVDDEDVDEGEDDDEREPCPDGACIGIIGPDGRCTECGLEAGAEPAPD